MDFIDRLIDCLINHASLKEGLHDICCGYSYEAHQGGSSNVPQRGASNEYPQYTCTVFNLITTHTHISRICSLQITASVLFVCFFIKAYVVGSHLNCNLNEYPQHQKRKSEKKMRKHRQISPMPIFFKCTLGRYM